MMSPGFLGLKVEVACQDGVVLVGVEVLLVEVRVEHVRNQNHIVLRELVVVNGVERDADVIQEVVKIDFGNSSWN